MTLDIARKDGKNTRRPDQASHRFTSRSSQNLPDQEWRGPYPDGPGLGIDIDRDKLAKYTLETL